MCKNTNFRRITRITGELILREESYKLVGVCMEVHRELGMGFKEGFYRDALEFKTSPYSINENGFLRSNTKRKTLKHRYKADVIVFDQIVLKVKARSFIVDSFVAQTINYLRASGLKLGIIANFGEKSLTYKRIVF